MQEKITYNYKKIELGVMDKELFKKLENSNIWEFRTLYNGNCYRLFSFWDTETDTLVIATHGIVKKTQKTRITCKSVWITLQGECYNTISMLSLKIYRTET